jgi:hypothetical protein
MTYAYWRVSGLATGLTRLGLETAGHHASRFRDPAGLEYYIVASSRRLELAGNTSPSNRNKTHGKTWCIPVEKIMFAIISRLSK